MMLGSWPLKVIVSAMMPPDSSVLKVDAFWMLMDADGVYSKPMKAESVAAPIRFAHVLAGGLASPGS